MVQSSGFAILYHLKSTKSANRLHGSIQVGSTSAGSSAVGAFHRSRRISGAKSRKPEADQWLQPFSRRISGAKSRKPEADQWLQPFSRRIMVLLQNETLEEGNEQRKNRRLPAGLGGKTDFPVRAVEVPSGSTSRTVVR
ncbi:hypothetical protein RvY_15518 [Ramazzottius varieornatus]|uniref:Uncharacterized protein n=1 Tax=Ramazzottius varieornatus TaxID=947166 RepID=A0A1D1VWE7_RAMVA|nr:hypothetical protein RvY_15518 [Ramazzottius varieornatus]